VGVIELDEAPSAELFSVAPWAPPICAVRIDATGGAHENVKDNTGYGEP
jgi:hypothetical protein